MKSSVILVFLILIALQCEAQQELISTLINDSIPSATEKNFRVFGIHPGWNLIRTESGGDGTGVVFIYTFKIEDELFLKDNDLNGSVLKLLIEGKERTFYFRMEKNGSDIN